MPLDSHLKRGTIDEVTVEVCVEVPVCVCVDVAVWLSDCVTVETSVLVAVVVAVVVEHEEQRAGQLSTMTNTYFFSVIVSLQLNPSKVYVRHSSGSSLPSHSGKEGVEDAVEVAVDPAAAVGEADADVVAPFHSVLVLAVL